VITKSISKTKAAVVSKKAPPPKPAPAKKANPEPKEVKAKKGKFFIPKTLAACADLLYTTREDRLAAKKNLDALEEHEKALKEHLINNLPKGAAKGVTGQIARVTIETEPVPTVEDWNKVYKYIAKTGSFDLLGRSISSKAVQLRWENKQKIPGIGTFNVVKVHINKAK